LDDKTKPWLRMGIVMKYFYFLLLILFLFHNPCKAQSNFGIHSETLFYFMDIKKESYNPKIFTKETSLETNFAISFSYTLITENKIGISLRPSIVLGSLYSGYDMGIFWLYYFDRAKYVLGGLNIHYNVWSPRINSLENDSVWIPYLIVGGGMNVLKNLFMEVQLNLPLNNEIYANEVIPIIYTQEVNTYYYKASWFLKLGIVYQI